MMEDCDGTQSIFGERAIICERLVLNIARGIWATIFATRELQDLRDQTVTRSAVFLIFPIVLLTVASRHTFCRVPCRTSVLV